MKKDRLIEPLYEGHYKPATPPYVDQMKLFQNFLHGKRPCAWQILDDRKNGDIQPSWLSGRLKDIQRNLVKANRQKAGIALVVNRAETGRKNRDVTRVNALFLDVDAGMGLQDLKELTPDMIVESSPGRYHCYWRIRGVKRDYFKKIQLALAEKFGADPSVCDLARAMRVPGTVNWKHDKPFIVNILFSKYPSNRTSVRVLCKKLGIKTPDGGKREVFTENLPAADAVRVADISNALQAIKDVGSREKWLKIGMALHHGLPNTTGFNLWKEWSVKWPKYDSGDQERTWEGFGKSSSPRTIRTLFQLAIADGWVPSENGELPHTVLALNDAFCQRVKDQLCFVPEENKWRMFKAPVWVADFPGVVDHARKVIEEMTKEARQTKDAVAQKLLGGYLKIPKIRALLSDASVSPDLNIGVTLFDRNPDLLAVQNGVVDLKTGEFRLGRPDDKLTMQAPTVYDPNAKCPQFHKLLKFVTRGNDEYTKYLQHALGYTICGHANKQVFFIVYGPGGNLKGTLFRAVGNLLGPLSTPISPNLMTRAYAGNPNSPSPAIMALTRARMFQCTEGEDGKRFDTAFVKQLTGNDELSGRGINADQARFTPVGKPWLATNSLPYVSSQDEAMWRRIQLLPFKRVMRKRDGSVEDSLALEASGIFNWLIEGAVLANSQRDLPKCEIVETATERARLNCDSVKYWLTENCVVRKAARLQSSRAFSAYLKFCRQQHLPPLSQQQFGRSMSAHGIFIKRASAHNEFRGIELRDPVQDMH